MSRESKRVAKVCSEDEQLTDILYQLEAIRDSMATIVEAQMDLYKLVAEGNRYYADIERRRVVLKRDPYWISINEKPTGKPRGIREYVSALGREDDGEEKKTEYAFCFDDLHGLSPWHLRVKPSTMGRLVSLCEKDMVYAVGVPVCKENLLTQKVCPKCAVEYLKLEGEKSDGNEKKNRGYYGTEEQRSYA